MERQGTEKAERVADLLQSVLRLVILVIIIPSALLLSVFYLLTPLIPDTIIRALASIFVGVGLAGLLLVKLGRIRIGSILLVTSAASASASFALSWMFLHTTVFCLHFLLIFILVVIKNLGEKGAISEERLDSLYRFLGIIIIITGAAAVVLTLQFLLVPISMMPVLLVVTLFFYLSVSQYQLKNPRLGILNSLLVAFTTGFIGLHLSISYTTNLFFILPSFFFPFGMGLLASSQIARKIQDRIYYRSESLGERERIQGYFEVVETIDEEHSFVKAIEWVNQGNRVTDEMSKSFQKAMIDGDLNVASQLVHEFNISMPQ